MSTHELTREKRLDGRQMSGLLGGLEFACPKCGSRLHADDPARCGQCDTVLRLVVRGADVVPFGRFGASVVGLAALPVAALWSLLMPGGRALCAAVWVLAAVGVV